MKDIPGYEGLYAVTSCGRVWSHRRKIFLKQVCDKDGYMHVQLHANAKVKRFQVHRLVAQAYIKNSDNIETVDHIDGNTKNNCVNNLQLLTRTQNRVKGKRNYVPKIKCLEDGNIFETQKECASYYGISISYVSSALSVENKTNFKKHFCYIEE